MGFALCVLLAASFFEVRFLVRSQEKKEAAVYIGISILTVALAVYLMLTPDYYSFMKFMNHLFHVK